MADMTMWLIIADWIWQINNKSHSAYVWPISGKTTTTNENNAHKYVPNEISWSRLFHAIELWIVDVFNSISLCCRDSNFPSLSLSLSLPLSHYNTHFFRRKNSFNFIDIFPFSKRLLCNTVVNITAFHRFTQCVGDQTAIFTFYASFLWAIFVGRCYLMDS